LDKDTTLEHLEKLNAFLEKHKTIAETDFDNENLVAILLAISVMIGFQQNSGLGLMEQLQMAMISGWTLGRRFEAGDADLIAMSKEFASPDDLAEILRQELATYFRDEAELKEFLAEQEKGNEILQ
jgi:hypothetical protein